MPVSSGNKVLGKGGAKRELFFIDIRCQNGVAFDTHAIGCLTNLE
jgi:hypothetical protein